MPPHGSAQHLSCLFGKNHLDDLGSPCGSCPRNASKGEKKIEVVKGSEGMNIGQMIRPCSPPPRPPATTNANIPTLELGIEVLSELSLTGTDVQQIFTSKKSNDTCDRTLCRHYPAVIQDTFHFTMVLWLTESEE